LIICSYIYDFLIQEHCVSQLSLPQELGVSALIIQCLIKKPTLLLQAREKTYPASGNTQWEKEGKRPFALHYLL